MKKLVGGIFGLSDVEFYVCGLCREGSKTAEKKANHLRGEHRAVIVPQVPRGYRYVVEIEA